MCYHKAVHNNFYDNNSGLQALEKVRLHACVMNRLMYIFIVNPSVLLRDKAMNRILRLQFCQIMRASRTICFHDVLK